MRSRIRDDTPDVKGRSTATRKQAVGLQMNLPSRMYMYRGCHT